MWLMEKKKPQLTLHRILDDYGSQVAVAEAFGISQSLVSKWIRGARSPGVQTAKRIEELSNGRYRADDLVFGR